MLRARHADLLLEAAHVLVAHELLLLAVPRHSGEPRISGPNPHPNEVVDGLAKLEPTGVSVLQVASP